jgi:hypothetical protein
MMDVVAGLLAATMGALALVTNRRFGEGSVESLQTFFGHQLSRGGRRFILAWSRAAVVIAGIGLMVGGIYFAFFA